MKECINLPQDCDWWYCRSHNYCLLGKENKDVLIPKQRISRDYPSQRRILINKLGGICVYCKATENLTIDHIIPKSKGGSNNIGNFQVLCRRCNHAKGDKIIGPDEKLKINSKGKGRIIKIKQ
jgi:5-methylcytosine-specific restriction endonuclease McrA